MQPCTSTLITQNLSVPLNDRKDFVNDQLWFIMLHKVSARVGEDMPDVRILGHPTLMERDFDVIHSFHK